MSFVQRELDRITVALREPQTEEKYNQLYAAQQSLSWVLEPGGYKYPYDMIMDTGADAGGYLLNLSPPLSLDIHGRCEIQ